MSTRRHQDNLFSPLKADYWQCGVIPHRRHINFCSSSRSKGFGSCQFMKKASSLSHCSFKFAHNKVNKIVPIIGYLPSYPQFCLWPFVPALHVGQSTWRINITHGIKRLFACYHRWKFFEEFLPVLLHSFVIPIASLLKIARKDITHP